MENIVIARYGEIHLKGENRGLFVRALEKNITSALNGAAKLRREGARLVVFGFEHGEELVFARRVADVFGVVSTSPAVAVKSSADTILEYVRTLAINGSFKVSVNRADKSFPHKSPEFAAMCGQAVLESAEHGSVHVDVNLPQTVIYIDIRENGNAYIYTEVVAGVGGMPVGTAGRALVMLSGGIDSPVAAWLAAKRGLAVDCIHFASPPYTSEFALDKVRRLAVKLQESCGEVRLHVVPFTAIQEAIRDNCKGEYMITLMRRFMVRIAEQLALKHNSEAIITGENLAQVASQTVRGITSNNFCAREKVILRPLITFDKNEIVTLAKRIGTYNISIEPHADCCTVFVPVHPSINPNIKRVEAEEARLPLDDLIAAAVASVETF